jgi:hypothetical protein
MTWYPAYHLLRNATAGPVDEPPGRAQTASPSQLRGLGCAVFRSARVPLGATRRQVDSKDGERLLQE